MQVAIIEDWQITTNCYTWYNEKKNKQLSDNSASQKHRLQIIIVFTRNRDRHSSLQTHGTCATMRAVYISQALMYFFIYVFFL